MKIEAFQTLNRCPVKTSTAITTFSFTQDAMRGKLKGAVSESFTLELIAEA